MACVTASGSSVNKPCHTLSVQPTRVSLLNALARADNAAWEKFFFLYGGAVRTFAARQGLDAAAADDVLQETALVLMRKLPDFQYDSAKGRFRNYLLTIVHRKVLDAHRRAGRRAEVPLEAPVGGEGLAPIDWIEDGRTPSQAERIETEWREALYAQALKRVLADHRNEPETMEIFRAYVLEGEDVVEVCRRYGVTANNVYQIKKRTLSRIARECRDLLGQDLVNHER